MPDIPNNGLRLTIFQLTLFRPTPTPPTMTVFRVESSVPTDVVPLHDSRNLLPHETEAITDVLHCFGVPERIFLGLYLATLACARKKFSAVEERLGSSSALLLFRRFLRFEGLADFSFAALARHCGFQELKKMQ